MEGQSQQTHAVMTELEDALKDIAGDASETLEKRLGPALAALFQSAEASDLGLLNFIASSLFRFDYFYSIIIHQFLIYFFNYFGPETEETMTSLVKAVLADDEMVITEEDIVNINAQKVIANIQGELTALFELKRQI